MIAYGWRDFTFCTTPKVASTSIAQAMAARGVAMLNYQAWSDRPKPVIVVVRDPVARFLSCWRFFSQAHKQFPAPIRGKPGLDDFLERAEATIRGGTANHHWQPQMEQIPRYDGLVPMERLAEFWSAHIGGDLPRVNATDTTGWLTTEQTARIRGLYAADLEAHAAALMTVDELMESLPCVAEPASRTPATSQASP